MYDLYNMSFQAYVVLNITIAILCQGQCLGFVSRTMGDNCGAEISRDEYAGELVLDTDATPWYNPQCTVTITPKPLNEHVPNRVMFYFTVYTFNDDCWQTNITIKDGRSIHDPGIVGLPQNLCSDTSVVTDQVFNTTSPSLTVVLSSNNDGRTSSTRFVIKYLAYHTDYCSTSDEHECRTGYCIPATYYCSQDINACSEIDQTCADDNDEEQYGPFQSIIRFSGILVVVVLIFVVCKTMLKKLKDQCGDMMAKCCDCCGLIRTKCRGCARYLHTFCATRVIGFIRDKCKKSPNRTQTTDGNNRAEPTVNTIATTISERLGNQTATLPERSRGQRTSVQSSNNNFDNIENEPDVQGLLLLLALEGALQNPSGVASMNVAFAPPAYDELFTPDHNYTPPVLDSVVLPVVPSYEEAIADTLAEDISVNTRALSNDENQTLNDSPSVRDSVEQNADTAREVADTECTPTTIRRLQADCGFEHPFDFETEFDYYYSTDSDWETDSVATSATVESLILSAMTIENETLQSNESHELSSETSQQSRLGSYEMPSSNNLFEGISSCVRPQAESTSSDTEHATGYEEIAPPSEPASGEVPSEPPPPYEDRSLPPYYYDYIANVSLYKR